MWSGTLVAPDSPERPGECIPHHNDFELALALFILVGMVVSYLPQVWGPVLSQVLVLEVETESNLSR